VVEYRLLNKGEIIQSGDEIDRRADGSTRKLAMAAENAIFEALALSGEPISKDTETWLNAAAMLLRRAIESI
jgi:hypothetical protein